MTGSFQKPSVILTDENSSIWQALVRTICVVFSDCYNFQRYFDEDETYISRLVLICS